MAMSERERLKKALVIAKQLLHERHAQLGFERAMEHADCCAKLVKEIAEIAKAAMVAVEKLRLLDGGSKDLDQEYTKWEQTATASEQTLKKVAQLTN